MRCIVLLGLFVLLTGCVPPVPDNMRRAAVAPLPPYVAPPPAPVSSEMTLPKVGYGSTMPSVPSGGLGAEAPAPMPKASRMPTIAAQPGVPPSAATSNTASGQSIMVPNGNGTTTIIHPDGTIETVPTAK